MNEKELKDACYHLLSKILANVVKDQFYSAEDNSLALTVALSRWRNIATRPSTLFSDPIKETTSSGTINSAHFDTRSVPAVEDTK